MGSDRLSARESQVMDAVYRLGKASAAEVRDQIDDPPTASAVRTWLGILVEKGQLRRVREGKRVLYVTVQARPTVARRALQRVLDVFFRGSIEGAVAAHFSGRRKPPSTEELDRLSRMVEELRERQRGD